MLIACDIDNTINNLQETVLDLFNKRYNANYKLDDFHAYDVMNALPTNEAVIMKEMYAEYGLYDLVKPFKEARVGLEKFINDGHQVYLVTDAVPITYGEKVSWIKRYFPFIDDAHIICMKHKHLLRCDIMIEDCVENLLAKPYYHRVLLDYEWNRHVRDYVYDIHRCYNWDQVVEAVNKICEE